MLFPPSAGSVCLEKTWWLKVLDIQGWVLLSQFSVYPELGWNELSVLVCFSVFELCLIWKGVWHKERLKQFGSLWLSFIQIYQDEMCYNVIREEEQTFMVYQSSFLRRALEWSENYTFTFIHLHFTVLTFQKFDIWNGYLNIFWEDAEDIAWICVCIQCLTLVFCHEGGTSTKQKEKKEISEQTIFTHYWEQQIVWRLAEHVWEQEDTNGGRYWKAGSCLCLYREELDLGDFILSKMLPWNIAMVWQFAACVTLHTRSWGSLRFYI